MNKFILRGGLMFLTFTIGLGGTFLINTVVERWIETPDPVLEEPSINVLAAQPRVIPLVGNCGLLVVNVANDRSITLNGDGAGSVDNPRKLIATLNEIFTRRTESRAYRSGIDLNSHLPEDESIEKLVFIRVPRWISYGDVSDLIDAVRATGAKPIALVTKALTSQSSLPESDAIWAQTLQPCLDGD
jgi:biopolymer transport protein ExbD